MFQELGVSDVLGVDGDWVPEEERFIPREQFKAWDLRESLHLDRRFDLAISLETAEHLPRECAETFVASICRLAPVVAFSAAVPDQPGIDHITLEWPSFWSRMFEGHGYQAIDCIRPAIWEDSAIPYWYRQNMFLLVHADQLKANDRLRALYDRHGGHPMSLPHPEMYSWLWSRMR
jgi:hypothetical protein